MTDTTLLLERAVREVSEHTEANSAAILVRKGAGYAPGGPQTTCCPTGHRPA